ERFDARTEAAEELLQTEEPLAALKTWSLELTRTATSYHGLVESMARALADETSDLYRSCHAMRTAVKHLVDRAREAGQLREDVTALEVLLLINSAAWSSEHAPNGEPNLERLLDLVFAGLRSG